MKCNYRPTFWDRKCFALIVLMALSVSEIFSQQKILTIKATSGKVDVKDGEVYQKGVWNLSPEVRPDIYYALGPAREKRITFYTDIDSVSFDTVPGNVYDFIILLNDKDTCYTQISAIQQVKQSENSPLYTAFIEPETLRQDFIIFHDALQKEHAGLYRYRDKKSFDKLFDSCYARLDHPMSQLEFGKIVMYFISSLEDGHTSTNIPRLLMNYYGDHEKMFPVYVYFIKSEAYVLCSKITELPAESEILSINDKPMDSIKEELLRYLPSDGKIETKKTQTLNNGAFTFIYRWIFGDKNYFIVRYKSKHGEIKTITLNAAFVKDFECDNGNNAVQRGNLDLEFPKESIALLTIKTFDQNKLAGQKNFSHFLDTAFKQINAKKISNLIIDLRGNGGGEDKYGALLYSYLTNKPFRYYSSIESVNNRINVIENKLLGNQFPQKNAFTGKVFFLINGLCFSTTADFCAIAKSNKRGKFIGEETGGAYYGNTSGQIITVELPGTKINIKIPLFKYVNHVKKAKFTDRGIIPDYSVMPNINEIILHKDIQLNFALRLGKGF